jgi:Stress responsive A/B Barrel Domain
MKRAVIAVVRAPSHTLLHESIEIELAMQIKHIVLLKVSAEKVAKEIEDAFQELASLVGRVPGLLDYSGGANNSPELKARGFTHGFAMTFADAASRDAYLPHPLHMKAAQQLTAILQSGDDAVLVIDWSHEV